jgi:hypothetical protein
MLRIPCLAVLLGLAACGDDLSSESLIGATCKKTEDCDVTGVCITSSKDGMCSMPCKVPGAAQECPLGAYCDSVRVETDEFPPDDMTLCLPACTAKTDCREGYECTGVSAGSGKVCKPKD